MGIKNKELWNTCKNLRKKKYDIVLDAQGNVKSAVIACFSRGLRCGMDKECTREKFVSLTYNKTFHIPVAQHAIARQRQLFAKALNYLVPDTFPDFAIQIDQLPKVNIELPKPYLMFIHSTSWNTKHWPALYWQQLIQMAVDAGYHVALPWGSVAEQARAKHLAQTFSSAVTVLPRLSIMEQASVIAGAAGAVCVDTGLGHLAAALNVPAVHLYGPTDPALIGATGHHQIQLSAEYKCAPCYRKDCHFGTESACFLNNMHPEKVWRNLQTLIA